MYDVVQNIPEHIQHMFTARTKAREEKNWTEADRLREEIKRLGFEVID
jgi:cysteinyl-tRNA synthetase